MRSVFSFFPSRFKCSESEVDCISAQARCAAHRRARMLADRDAGKDACAPEASEVSQELFHNLQLRDLGGVEPGNRSHKASFERVETCGIGFLVFTVLKVFIHFLLVDGNGAVWCALGPVSGPAKSPVSGFEWPGNRIKSYFDANFRTPNTI